MQDKLCTHHEGTILELERKLKEKGNELKDACKKVEKMREAQATLRRVRTSRHARTTAEKKVRTHAKL